MSVFRDYTAFFGTGTGTISPGGATVRFGVFTGSVDGINQTFAAPEVLGVTKDDFLVYHNGVLVDRNDYLFITPNVVKFTVIVPTPPDRHPEYMIISS